MEELVLPHWIVAIAAVLYALGFLGGVGIIASVLRGYVNPQGARKRGDSSPRNTSAFVSSSSVRSTRTNWQTSPQATSTGDLTGLRKRLHDYIADNTFENTSAWSSFQIDTPHGARKIPTLDIRWAPLFYDQYRDLLEAIGKEFISKYGDEIAGARIYLISQFSLDFFVRLRRLLLPYDITVTLCEEFYPTPPPTPGQKVILFDVSYSTGRTTVLSLDQLMDRGIKPDLFLFLFYNDLVPPQKQNRAWMNINAEMRFLIQLSDIIQLWEEQQEMADAMLTIRDASYGQADWSDHLVIESLETLNAKLVQTNGATH
jgi:hypothetical protein